MIRAVLDTNVIVSSFLTPLGIPSQIVEAWKADEFFVCLSEPLLEEAAEVLRRPAIARACRVSPNRIQEFLDLVAKTAIFHEGRLDVEPVVAVDPDDDTVLATALALEADVIVSGDRHLLDMESYRGIPILTPRQFLDVLKEARER